MDDSFSKSESSADETAYVKNMKKAKMNKRGSMMVIKKQHTAGENEGDRETELALKQNLATELAHFEKGRIKLTNMLNQYENMILTHTRQQYEQKRELRGNTQLIDPNFERQN